MALIRNGTSLGTNNLRHGGAVVYTLQRDRWTTPGGMRGLGVGVLGAAACGRPSGYGGESGAAWLLPRVGGGMTTYETMEHGHEIEANVARGINLLSEMVGDGSISTAALSTVVSLVCEMLSASEVDASLLSVAQLAAELVSAGQVDAAMRALANLASSLESLGGLEGAVLRGTLAMAAEMATDGGAAELTAADIARAVWDEVAAAHTDAGTTGAELARITKIVKAILGMSA